MRWGCDAPNEAVQSALVRTLNATRLRRNTVIVIVIVIGDRIRRRLESDTTRLYWNKSHESGEERNTFRIACACAAPHCFCLLPHWRGGQAPNTALDRRPAALHQQQRSRPKPRPFSFESDAL
ncbi:hypothetical protein HBH70_082290 [Parastagonospora nodorum]|nr:hypothetical protein HBH50_099710 [Parastagonospora nodorum]KAH4089898.1 hypothetical protein HBH48_103490 [Parastagonospora nodorum]KAH4125124.1 hypothetical protein HBH47_065850 [Parastagonospora nodorum]KAH4174003.1 hypothetical protein HBH43_085950 [Parastagonospora nodorum]KAH4606976.1 hypothetical protein HBH82_096280 [Parastagonospora nodorum]